MQNNQPDHTFVICAYKESPYLEECIQSLLSQTVKSRILLVTSTPNEHIEGLVNKYNLEYSVNTGKAGIAQDWNYGCDQVKTKYFTIAHQDDVYKPDYLEQALKCLCQSKDPLIFFSDYGELRDGQEVVDTSLLKIKQTMLLPLRWKALWRSRFVRRRILAFGNAICCPSVTYCKGNLPSPIFVEYFKSNMDWMAWEAISRRKGSFVYCHKVLMLHRIHEESTTSELIHDDKRTEEDYQVFLRFWPAPMAKVIARIYKKSEKSNEVQHS